MTYREGRQTSAILAAKWREMDLKDAKKRLQNLQKDLTIAAANHDRNSQIALQKIITADLGIRCLAVRHVAQSHSSCGMDGVIWRTPAELFQAACDLSPERYHYHTREQREIHFISKSTGRKRIMGLPTYFDKAMSRLYFYALAPILEAQHDTKSFAFRKGRSVHDAHAYLQKALVGSNAPKFVVTADVSAFFASMQHRWIMQHIPMDKHVLHELIASRRVFAGKLFPRDDQGVSLGLSLSCIIANYMLDGLQGFLYKELHKGNGSSDDSQINLVRFADDIAVTASSYEQGQEILGIISEFLDERGLSLNYEKSAIHTVQHGFSFLNITYKKSHERLSCTPKEASTDRFISQLSEICHGWRYSQRDLINKFNKKLSGWAGYNRYFDAAQAFRKVDDEVAAMLLSSHLKRLKVPRVSRVTDKFFDTVREDHYVYCLPKDPTVRIMCVSDTLLVHHKRCKAHFNAYRDLEYLEERTHEKEAFSVSGPYKEVWKRQDGCCYHCGEPILIDQPKRVIQVRLDEPMSYKNAAYVHEYCLDDPCEIIETYDPLTSFSRYDAEKNLRETLALKEQDEALTHHSGIPLNWKYIKLKIFFAHQEQKRLTLSFKEVEKILGCKLPKTARISEDFWSEEGLVNGPICLAWTTEDYQISDVNLKNEKLRFERVKPNYAYLVIPREITEQRLCDEARYRISVFFKMIIKDYGLAEPYD